MSTEGGDPVVVVMAKLPVSGQVKTRLTPAISPEAAAAVHKAMLSCVLERFERVFGPRGAELVLALDVGFDEEVADAWQATMELHWPRAWRGVRQGDGDLGHRISCVADAVLGIGDVQPELGSLPAADQLTPARAIAFFGVDSPDVPASELAAIWARLTEGSAAVGPVSDGGYWTLAAKPWSRSLAVGIDWGTSKVYDQTCDAITRADLACVELLPWFDVDWPEDLAALRQRLEKSSEPALDRLAKQLNHICKES